MATTCTPSENLAQYKCLACLSESEKLKVLLMALASLNGYSLPDDLGTIMEEAKCYNCLSNGQLLQSIVAVMADNQLSSYTVAELQEQGKCLRCADSHRILAAIAYQICTYFGS